MKIRNGFVSNSSSSSFVLLGAFVEMTGEMKDKIEDHDFLQYLEDDEEGDIIGVNPNYLSSDKTVDEWRKIVISEINKEFPGVNVDSVYFVAVTTMDY